MGAAWTVFRAGVRRRWRAWVALALLIGLFAAVVTALAAGARRTDSAYPRLLTWSRAPDLMFYTANRESATFASPSVAGIEQLPAAATTAAISAYTVLSPGDAEIYAPQTNAIPGVFFRRKILSGRLPDPGRVNEADVSFTLAQQHHLRVGDWFRLTLLPLRGRPPVVRFRIVGIDAAPSEFPPQTGSGINLVWATPAFYRHEQREPVSDGIAVAMRLRRGAAGLLAALREAQRLAAGKLVLDYPLAIQAVNTERSIHLLAVALWLLAGLIGLVGLLITGQLLARLSFVESDDYATLRALGMTQRQLLAAALGRAALIGAAQGQSAPLWPWRYHCSSRWGSPRSRSPARDRTLTRWCSPPGSWGRSRSRPRLRPGPPGMPSSTGASRPRRRGPHGAGRPRPRPPCRSARCQR